MTNIAKGTKMNIRVTGFLFDKSTIRLEGVLLTFVWNSEVFTINLRGTLVEESRGWTGSKYINIY